MDILMLIGGMLVSYLIYSKGVQDGIKLEKGHKVSIVPNPIEKAKERKETAKNEKVEEEKVEAINNLMDYDGFKQKAGD